MQDRDMRDDDLHGLEPYQYVTKWVAVKIRWRLNVDPAEKRFLTQQANECENVLINVRRASIQTAP